MTIISLPQPSMSINAWNMDKAFFPIYKMYNTWLMDQQDTIDHIVGWIGVVADKAPGGKLKCLVVNGHGNTGYTRLSAPAQLDINTAEKFGATLRGKIDHIIITSCDMIGVKPGASDSAFLSDAGVKMVAKLARGVNAKVYAGNSDQAEDASYVVFGGHGDIDGFEGDVLMMRPTGRSQWLTNNDVLAAYLKGLAD